MPIGTRNVFLKYYTNSNTESSFIDAMRWSKPDMDGYMKEIHNTVDTILMLLTLIRLIQMNNNIDKMCFADLIKKG